MAEPTKTNVEFLEQFEPDVFWSQHGRKIIWGAVALLVIGVVFFLKQRQEAERDQETANRLAQAADPSVLQQIAHDSENKAIAAQALLRLADMHFQAGRLPEAAAAYQELLSRFPSSPLADSARLGQVAILEVQGNLEAAKSQYLQLASQQGKYTVIAAKIGAARCAEALGQTKEARQLYEELMTAVMGTPWEAKVTMRWAVLARTQEPQATQKPLEVKEPKPLSLLPQSPPESVHQ